MLLPSTPAAMRCFIQTSRLSSSSLLAPCVRVPISISISTRCHHHSSKPLPRPQLLRPFPNIHKLPSCTITDSRPLTRHSSTSTTIPPASLTTTTTAPPPPPTSTETLPPTTPSIPTPQTTTSPSSSSSPPLPWSTFLHLRRTRRFYNLTFSLLTASATTVSGIYFLTQLDFGSSYLQVFGFDPMITMGLTTVACGAMGWLVGPFAGGAVFGIVYRRLAGEIAVKEKQFYQRIKRYRADPASQSMANPAPDYYGEKVDSVAAYRQWLKDQRAFTRKRQSY